MDDGAVAARLIDELALEPHPEGGHYRRVRTSPEQVDGRPVETAILYLLAAGERSHWHRIDATETWTHVEGDVLEVSIAADGAGSTPHLLVPDGPDVTVPPHAWQAATPLGAYTLVRCTVRPGFTFDGFELAPPGWEPGPLSR